MKWGKIKHTNTEIWLNPLEHCGSYYQCLLRIYKAKIVLFIVLNCFFRLFGKETVTFSSVPYKSGSDKEPKNERYNEFPSTENDYYNWFCDRIMLNGASRTNNNKQNIYLDCPKWPEWLFLSPVSRKMSEIENVIGKVKGVFTHLISVSILVCFPIHFNSDLIWIVSSF